MEWKTVKGMRIYLLSHTYFCTYLPKYNTDVPRLLLLGAKF